MINELLQQYSSENHKNLKLLRDRPHYDILEQWLHQTTMLLMINKLQVKVAEAKQKNPGVDMSEQLKMIADLGETVFWMKGLQEQSDYYMRRCAGLEQGMKDLNILNQMLQQKHEEQENKIKKLEEQQSF